MPVITAVLPRAIFPARVIPRRAELPQVRVACDHDARTVAVAFRVTVDARRETATERVADVDATPVAGNWRYLRKTQRRAARARARQSDTESDDDDPPRRRARPRA